MALTKENLQQLVALQEKDSALDKVKATLDAIPVMIARLKEAVEAEKAKASGAKNKVIDFEKKKKEKELDLAKKEEDAKKRGGELNTVKTNEAFKAIQVEIERAKADASKLETEILELMDAIDAAKKEEKTLVAELAVEAKKFEEEIASHEKRQAGLQAEYDAAKAARDAEAAKVEAPVMKIYAHVRARGKLDAVVAIDGDSCSACRMSLAPQVIVEATKAKSLVTCESCQRILYKPQSLAAAKAA